MKSATLVLILASSLGVAYGQRPRTMDQETAKKPAASPAPKTVKAKYEGGVFGYTKTMEGTLTFDDANNQLLFKDGKSPKEFHIPYDAVTSAFADTKKVQPQAASVASAVPLIYTFPAHFIKTKVRYLTLQYNDLDTRVSGATSFKFENRELLESVLATLAEKTGMSQRGDIYVKKKDTDPTK